MGFRGFFDSLDEVQDKIFRLIKKSTTAERFYIKEPTFEFSKEELEISIYVIKLDLDKIIPGYEDIFLEEHLKPIYRQVR